MVSRAETRRRWWERVARFEAGAALTVAEFCEAEGVSAASFYLWRRRFRESAEDDAAAASSASPATALSSASSSSSAGAARTPRLLPVVMTGGTVQSVIRGEASHSSTLDLELPNQIRLRLPRDIEAEFVSQLLSTCAALAPHPAAASSGRSEAR